MDNYISNDVLKLAHEIVMQFGGSCSCGDIEMVSFAIIHATERERDRCIEIIDGGKIVQHLHGTEVEDLNADEIRAAIVSVAVS